MMKPFIVSVQMIGRRTLATLPRVVLFALPVLAAHVAAGSHNVSAAAPKLPNQASGRVLVHFALSRGAKGEATWSGPYRVIKASAQQFSGCAIVTDHVLHSRQLVVHVWPRTTSEFLTRDFKLTVSLTSSGAVSTSPIPPTVAIGFRGDLYTVLNSSSASTVTVRQGGRAGTFDIRNVVSSANTNKNVRVVGSWSCTGLMRFNS